MSAHQLFQIFCDADEWCDECADSVVSIADARRKAKEDGWIVGRGVMPDLCPEHRKEYEGHNGS